MIAFLPEPPTSCPSCGSGPCHDGTTCNSAHLYRTMRVYVGPSRNAPDFPPPDDRRDLIMERYFSHPRFQQQPRSPVRRFRKR